LEASRAARMGILREAWGSLQSVDSGLGSASRYVELSVYPHPYPLANRDPPELAGAHHNNRTQSDSTGGSPRFRYAVPNPPSADPRSDRAVSLPAATCLNPYLPSWVERNGVRQECVVAGPAGFIEPARAR
jgi:hypothetical protein